MRNLNELSNNIKIRFNNRKLYETALTHPSYNADAKTKHQDYEKMEFMGDAVLGFVSADLIYKNHQGLDQGNMTKLRSNLVKTSALASYARSISLADYIRTGHSIDPKNVNKSDKILEDVFEALIGAIFLDQGLKTAYKFIEGFLLDLIINFDESTLTDYKTKLQEEMQAEYRDSVKYVVIETTGPAHDRRFKVNVLFNDIVLGTGEGKSKKKAQEAAAKDALDKRSVL